MRLVTKEEFFQLVYSKNLNVHPTIVSGFPYKTIWVYLRSPNGAPFGKTVEELDGAKIVKSYYINEAQ